MPHKIVHFRTDKRFVRRARELETIEAMAVMYCRGQRHAREASEKLCTACSELFTYATRRLERCVFGDAKPTCANCLVHCYTAEMRERVRVMMRWAGPRMLFRHPLLAIRHKLDGLRASPTLPEKPAKRRSASDQ